jgi:hypothetical protein
MQPHLISPVFLVGLALLSTALENVAVFGFDNLAVPVVLALGLRALL